MKLPGYYTAAELKKYLKISQSTYVRWIETGKLQSDGKINGHIFKVETIEKLIHSMEEPIH